MTYHISGIDSFKKKFPKYPKCAHKRLTKVQARKKEMVVKGTPAYEAITKVIPNKKYLEDMKLLANANHTGNLEVFHSLINTYAPKRQEFELNVQNARVQLAIIDHNENVG